jgi:protein gp37
METTEMSKIEWTEKSWNPFVGCSKTSPGCDNCYAIIMAHRQSGMGRPQYQGTTTTKQRVVWTGKVGKAPDHILQIPLQQTSRTTYFVCSMSDFFHKNAKDAWRLEALDVAKQCPQHTFQILTKRPENIMPFLERTGSKLPSNVWLGITVENRKALKRIDQLRKVHAEIRFISIKGVETISKYRINTITNA